MGHNKLKCSHISRLDSCMLFIVTDTGGLRRLSSV